jgi:chromosomal replication initiation ATPase DnaA
MLGGKARYCAFVGDGIKDGHKEEYYEAQDQRFLGTEGFAEKLREQRDEPQPTKRRALESVVKALGKEFGVGVAELRSADRSWAVSKVRTMIGYVLIRRQ